MLPSLLEVSLASLGRTGHDHQSHCPHGTSFSMSPPLPSSQGHARRSPSLPERQGLGGNSHPPLLCPHSPCPPHTLASRAGQSPGELASAWPFCPSEMASAVALISPQPAQVISGPLPFTTVTAFNRTVTPRSLLPALAFPQSLRSGACLPSKGGLRRLRLLKVNTP